MDYHGLVFVLPVLCIVHSQNLSQNGTAVQKTTYDNRFHAKLAITGGPTNNWYSGSCSTTAGGETNTWWRLTFSSETVYFTDIHIWYRSENQSVDTLSWPAISLELNLIHNIWCIIGRQGCARTPPVLTLTESDQSSHHECQGLTQLQIQRFVDGMGWRLETVIREDAPSRLAGYYLYVSNTTSITNAYLCFHDEGPDLPSVNQIVECNHLGKHIIIYNERRPGVSYPHTYDAHAWLELCDVQVYGCYKTWFGNQCEIKCSSKCIDQHCYPGNGSCVWGCNCLHNNCDNSTACTEGCEKGFAGQYCKEYNVASYGFAIQHPSPGIKQAEFAIDGDWTEESCSKTSGQQAWWQVDLGGITVVKAVYITYQLNDTVKQRAINHSVYIHGAEYINGLWTNGTKLDMASDFNNSFPSIIYLVNPVLLGQYLIYVPHQNENGIAYVDICEVEIAGCPSRSYGHDCNNTCPDNCYESCHPDTGLCSFGCIDGWTGPLCDQKCNSTTFGKNCEGICNCMNSTCNHVNGTCPSDECQAGWKGDSCSTACTKGNYGPNCVETCHGCVDESCNRFTGKCTIEGTCKPGFIGNKCNQECTSPLFGIKCQNICHCLDNQPCNRVNGACPSGGCQAGWSGQSCDTACSTGMFGFNCNESCDGCLDNSCITANGHCTDNSGCKPGWKTGHIKCNIPCDDGFYGDCLSQCHCREGICDKITGMCRNSQCASGWMGKTCIQECHSGSYSYNCENNCDTCNNTRCDRFNGTCLDGCIDGYKASLCDIKVKQQMDDSSFPVAALGGGVAAFVIVVCIVVIAVIYCRRHKHKDTTDQQPSYANTQITQKRKENIYSKNNGSGEVNDDWRKDSDFISMSVMTTQHVNDKQVTRPEESPITVKK